MRPDNKLSFDTLRSSYGCGMTFQLSVAADKSDKEYRNLLYYNVTDPVDVNSRIHYLNFRIEEFVTLRHGNQTFKPVLSHYEGYDEMGNKLNFQMSFIVPDFTCNKVVSESFDDITVSFDDPFWSLGTNHFNFDKELFISSPKLRLQ
jgi:hypothetical protein